MTLQLYPKNHRKEMTPINRGTDEPSECAGSSFLVSTPQKDLPNDRYSLEDSLSTTFIDDIYKEYEKWAISFELRQAQRAHLLNRRFKTTDWSAIQHKEATTD
jgi:hypothetical protein